MNKNIVLASICALASLYAEPSAFSAGDLSQKKPYGLNSNEKLLLKNIKTVKTLNRDKNTLYSQIDTLQEDLDGLRSVVEGLSQHQVKHTKEYKAILHSLDDINIKQGTVTQDITKIDDKVALLRKNVDALITLQEQNYNTLQEAFRLMDGTISEIETSYVSKKNFLQLQNELNTFKSLVLGQFKKLNQQKKPVTQGKPSVVYSKAQKALKSGDNTKAISLFSHCIKVNYKPAGSHYYSAEAYFAMGRYDKAIAFYKESYKRYKKGKYNRTLFLHTAIALDKTGNSKNAKGFYKKVIKEFPTSKEARIAKKALGK